MMTPPKAADVACAASQIDWSALVPLARNAGSPFEILNTLVSFGFAAGFAAESNQQLAASLNSGGNVALVEFQLYARNEAAALVHYLTSLNLVLARPGALFHDPAENKRLELVAANELVARIGTDTPPDAEALAGPRTAQNVHAQHAPGVPHPDADASPVGEQTGHLGVTPAMTRARAAAAADSEATIAARETTDENDLICRLQAINAEINTDDGSDPEYTARITNDRTKATVGLNALQVMRNERVTAARDIWAGPDSSGLPTLPPTSPMRSRRPAATGTPPVLPSSTVDNDLYVYLECTIGIVRSSSPTCRTAGTTTTSRGARRL